jgi:GMC oxidoreductase
MLERAGRAGWAGWRKKCFKLPIRCFKLPIRDGMAVVDPALRVHGIAGLRVADAAIMPTVVSSNTHAATIMIGERVADLVRETLRLAACLFPQGALCKTVASHRQPAGREAR